MLIKLVEWVIRATGKRENKKFPSAKAERVISRLEPNPPKPLPVSMPAKARKKVIRAKRYMTTRKSPKVGSDSRLDTNGKPSGNKILSAKIIYGVRLNIQEASLAITSSL